MEQKFIRIEDNMIFIVSNNDASFRQEPRLVGVNIQTGMLAFISEYKASRGIYLFDGKLFLKVEQLIYTIDPSDGKITEVFDFQEIFKKYTSYDMESYIFREAELFVSENKLIVCETNQLNFICIDLESKEVIFHHQFKRGKDIDKTTLKIETPIYYQGKIYVNAVDPTALYVFDLDSK